MSGPYTTVRFIPTGGINPDNLSEYLQFPKVLACGGTWIARSDLVAEGKFEKIKNNTRKVVGIVRTLKDCNSAEFE